MSIASDLYDKDDEPKLETKVTSVRAYARDIELAKKYNINLSKLFRAWLQLEIKRRESQK